MEKIEERIKKELEAKNTNKKTYIWIFSLLTLTTFIAIYSYQTNTGVLSKHTLHKEVTVKNQDNLELLFNENQAKRLEEQKQEQAKIVANNTKEEVSKNDVTMQEEPSLVLLEKPFRQDEIPNTKQISVKKSNVSVQKPQQVASKLKQEPEIKEKPLVLQIDFKTPTFYIVSCLEYQSAALTPNKACENKIKNLLEQQSDIKQIELIPIINTQDLKNTQQSEANFAKARLNAMVNLIKTFSTTAQIGTQNNYLKLSFNQSGVVIRFYK